MANRQTTTGRMTKAERREQARRERAELQRKMARARRNRWIAFGVVVVLAAGAGVFALTRPGPDVPEPSELLAQAASARRAAGCGEVDTIGPYQPEGQDRVHVASDQLPPLSNYPSVPPTSGPHHAVTLGAGVYDEAPSMGRVLHSLEHGAAVVWYAPGVDERRLDRLRAFYGQSGVGDRVIVAPYDYPDQGEAGRLPAGTEMALVAWHHLETCAELSPAAAFDFTARYSAPPYGNQTYRGNAPEAGAAI